MLTIYKANEMGGFSNDWLRARYHFSFGDYHNDNRMGFGSLRVINDDIIGAGTGFPMHPHRDMEIITYVREGVINHRDSLGNEGRTSAGDVQVMSAGTGIIHGESADPAQDTKAFQIWIMPREKRLPPRWAQREFPKGPAMDGLPLLVSGRADDADKGALPIYQDAAIYGGRIALGASLNHTVKGSAYIVMSEGSARLNGEVMQEGDGAELTGQDLLAIEALEDAAILVIEMDAPGQREAGL